MYLQISPASKNAVPGHLTAYNTTNWLSRRYCRVAGIRVSLLPSYWTIPLPACLLLVRTVLGWDKERATWDTVGGPCLASWRCRVLRRVSCNCRLVRHWLQHLDSGFSLARWGRLRQHLASRKLVFCTKRLHFLCPMLHIFLKLSRHVYFVLRRKKEIFKQSENWFYFLDLSVRLQTCNPRPTYPNQLLAAMSTTALPILLLLLLLQYTINYSY